jgi:hypothetical protein
MRMPLEADESLDLASRSMPRWGTDIELLDLLDRHDTTGRRPYGFPHVAQTTLGDELLADEPLEAAQVSDPEDGYVSR